MILLDVASRLLVDNVFVEPGSPLFCKHYYGFCEPRLFMVNMPYWGA